MLRPAEPAEPLDRALLARLVEAVRHATTDLDGYDYARAMDRVERFFWSFCDNYLELAKGRSYGDADDPGTRSARAALRLMLSVVLRMFAPFLPFVCGERACRKTERHPETFCDVREFAAN